MGILKKSSALALAFFVMLISAGGKCQAADDYVKNVEVVESDIRFDKGEFPRIAYLYLDIKNNGDKTVSNAVFEISYHDTDGFPFKKVVLKKALDQPIPPGQERKYKIRLKGRGFNENNDQYPYKQHYKVGSFDIKILNVQLSRK